MKKQKVLLLFGSFSALCLAAVVVMAFINWKLSADLKEIKADQPSEIISPMGSLLSPWLKDSEPWQDGWGTRGYFSDLQKRMDEMMNTMAPGVSIFNNNSFGYASTRPIIKMEETSDQYEIVVTVPEGQEIELNTEIKDGQLVISGQVKNEKEKAQGGSLARVFQTSQFSQSLYLSAAVDESAMRVDHDKNQFTITLPKV